MKKHNYFLVSLMAIMTLVAFVSCDAEAPIDNAKPDAPKGTVEVTLNIAQEKNLSSDVDRAIDHWEFMATPKFAMGPNEMLYGTVKYWKPLPELNTSGGNVKSTANLGRYTSGEWYFELRALNVKNHVISIGSTTQVLRKGVDNTVNITMLVDRADGTHGESADLSSIETGAISGANSGSNTVIEHGKLHIGFLINKLASNLDDLSISIAKQKIAKNGVIGPAEDIKGINWMRRSADDGQTYTKWWENATTANFNSSSVQGFSATPVEEGKVYYECIIEDLDAGPYIYYIQFNGKNSAGSMIPIAGQAVNVTIVGGEETQIKGTLLPNEYIKTDLSLTEIGTIYGTINGKNYLVVDAQATANLTWQQTDEEAQKSNETAVKYYWIMDGIPMVGNEKSVSFECPLNEKGTKAWGIHRVVCVPIGNRGSLGSATIDVIFNPPEGPGSVDDFPWPEDSDLRPRPHA